MSKPQKPTADRMRAKVWWNNMTPRQRKAVLEAAEQAGYRNPTVSDAWETHKGRKPAAMSYRVFDLRAAIAALRS